MIVTGDIAQFSAEAGSVTRGAHRKEIQLRIDGSRTLPGETVIPVQDLLPCGMILQEIRVHEGIGAVRPPVVDGALPGVQPVPDVHGVPRARFRAFPAAVAERARERRIGFQRRIGHEKDKADKRPEFRGDGIAFAADGGQSADARGVREIQDDIGNGLPRRDRFGMFQFICVGDFRIGGVIAFDSQI